MLVSLRWIVFQTMCYSYDTGPNEAGDWRVYDSDIGINSRNNNNNDCYAVDDLEIWFDGLLFVTWYFRPFLNFAEQIRVA